MLRDGPGYAWYFMFYEWSKRQCGVSDADKETTAYQNKSKSEVSLALMMCGGFSGQTYWLLSYPADFLKTRLQTAAPTPGCKKSMITIAREIFRENGLIRIYRGIHVVLIRSFPANAAAMFVFEVAKSCI